MNCIIIGAGVAGVVAAKTLSQHGVKVVLLEKTGMLLPKIAQNHTLFADFRESKSLIAALTEGIDSSSNIDLHLNAEVLKIDKREACWCVETTEKVYEADVVLLASGYDYFDASKKEELGYGIYKGVHTSYELEEMFNTNHFVNATGDVPKVLAFLQCVGSRDEKIGNHYCSKVCCVKAVKQAIEVKKHSPETEVYLFYMDLRMAGQGYEEMYREAQEKYHVKFIRGRVSEVATTYDGKVQLKAEDTLIGLPVKMTADMLILMVGMEPSKTTKALAQELNIADPYGFVTSYDAMETDQITTHKGLFTAGASKRPMNIMDTVADAKAASLEILNYLK